LSTGSEPDDDEGGTQIGLEVQDDGSFVHLVVCWDLGMITVALEPEALRALAQRAVEAADTCERMQGHGAGRA
jgi:hypothetical protein